MTHTPGAWMVGGVENTCVTPSTDTHERICVCWDTAPKQLDDGSWEDHTQEIQANARLIAAAPELLAALKAHLPWQDEPVQGWGCWADAVAAINKAEGRGE